MTNYRTVIGMRLSRLRSKNLMTQEALAEKFGISVEYYRLIEKGEYLPNLNIINCIHDWGWDVDYVLTGTKAKDSAFSVHLKDMGECRRNNICNLLIYKMRTMLNSSEDSSVVPYEPIIRESGYGFYTPKERIRDVILTERKYIEPTLADFAMDLNISEKTVGRWLSGKSKLKTEMVLSIYSKYKYYPSYILYGELNSNSKCDMYFRKLSDEDKKEVLKFEEALIEFM